MKTYFLIIVSAVALALTGCQGADSSAEDFDSKKASEKISEKGSEEMTFKIKKSDKEWREQLTPLQYEVTRKKGTERAFTGRYNDFQGDGIYKCVACGNDLFSSDTKYNSGSGWPSYWKPISGENVLEVEDNSMYMKRTEVVCSNCGAHLGHVFGDGPQPTGLRYCINSAALDFDSENDSSSSDNESKTE